MQMMVIGICACFFVSCDLSGLVSCVLSAALLKKFIIEKVLTMVLLWNLLILYVTVVRMMIRSSTFTASFSGLR